MVTGEKSQLVVTVRKVRLNIKKKKILPEYEVPMFMILKLDNSMSAGVIR